MKDTDNFPESWADCSLADIVVINPKNDANAEQVAGFVPMALAPTHYHGTLKYEEKLWGEIKKSYTNFANGDVIFAKVTPCFENGKAAIVREMPNGIGAGSSEFYVLRPANKEISSKLIFAIIKTQTFMQLGAENMTGAVGLRRVPRAFVETFPIALPSSVEQKAIADKLDALLAQVETTQARLERIPQVLKRFRQSVLAAAVSGKLTATTNISTWKQVTIGQVANDIRYGTSKKCSESTGSTPVLRIPNIGDGYVLQNNLKFADFEEKETAKLALKQGDLLLIRSNGSLDLVGKTALVREADTGLLYAGYLIRLRLDRQVADPAYVSICLRSLKTRAIIEEKAKSTSGVNNINSKELASLELFLPSLSAQHEIVRRVDELFAHADRIEQQVNNALARVNNLTQSILAKAFRGELTEQWRKNNPELISGENSAEALLERIKAERAAVAGKKKPRKVVRKAVDGA